MAELVCQGIGFGITTRRYYRYYDGMPPAYDDACRRCAYWRRIACAGDSCAPFVITRRHFARWRDLYMSALAAQDDIGAGCLARC